MFPNEGRKLHTTRSWEFMGLERDGRVPADSLWTQARYGEDVIIGNLDTGMSCLAFLFLFAFVVLPVYCRGPPGPRT